MQRVAHHRFLYDRGGSFYFRRAIPEDAREAFGKREVITSLGTRNLSEARRRMAGELDRYERALRLAREPALASSTTVSGERVVPERSDIERRARAWLRSWIDTAYAGSAEDAEQRARDTALMADEARRVLDERRGGQSLLLVWTADQFTRTEGWLIEPGSALHGYLLRTLGAAYVEAAAQLSAVTSLDARPPADRRFSPEHAEADAEADEPRKNRPAPVSPRALLDAYATQVRLSPATEKAWRRQVDAFQAYLGHSDARRVRPEDVIAWKDRLLEEDGPTGRRSPRTVRDTYLAALKAVFGWARENHRVAVDPTQGVRVRVGRSARHRDPGLSDAEAKTILTATLADHRSTLAPEHALARRWVPWLCAYSGARVNEMTQLRAEDVFQDGEVWTVRVTPDAGSTKTGDTRTFPLHSHLIEQGFLDVVRGKAGPLFYAPTRYRGGKQGNPQYKKVGERLAKWVREIGVDDPNVAPNHGWRHRFKTEARRHKLDPAAADVIQGHAPRTEGERYGDRAVELKREIEKLPRYELEGQRPIT